MVLKMIGVCGAFAVATFVGAISSQQDSIQVESRQMGSKQENKVAGVASVDSSDQQDQARQTPKPLRPESLLGTIHFGFSHADLKPDQSCASCHQMTGNQKSAYSPYFLEFFSADARGQGADVAFLGVNAENVPEAIQSHLRLESRQGTLVKNVVEESPAYHCGIEKHDVLLSIDQQPIEGEKGLLEMVRSRKPGTKITIDFVRAGKKESCQLVLGKQKTAQMIKSFQIHGCKAQLTSSTKCQNCHKVSAR